MYNYFLSLLLVVIPVIHTIHSSKEIIILIFWRQSDILQMDLFLLSKEIILKYDICKLELAEMQFRQWHDRLFNEFYTCSTQSPFRFNSIVVFLCHTWTFCYSSQLLQISHCTYSVWRYFWFNLLIDWLVTVLCCDSAPSLGWPSVLYHWLTDQ